jgi:hypothetical protein
MSAIIPAKDGDAAEVPSTGSNELEQLEVPSQMT